MDDGMREITARTLRDMDGGVLVLDTQGTVLYLNRRGLALLGRDGPVVGRKFAAAFFEEACGGANDAFNQFVLEAVYDKERSHSGLAPYRRPDGEGRTFSLTSSFLRSDDGSSNIGVVVVFSDVTEVETLHRQKRESSIVFAVLMICVCGYLFLWSLLRFLDAEPPGWVMNLMIEGISIIMFFIILRTTSFSLKDIGLRIADPKGTFAPSLAITAAGAAAMLIGKAAALRLAPGLFPEGAPFWDWGCGTAADIFYPLTAVLQEFLARGVMQENLRRIFAGRHAAALSIIISALVFGVLHISYGLPTMAGASLLLGALGILYHKQGNIWGLSIIHYVLGEVATFLGFLF